MFFKEVFYRIMPKMPENTENRISTSFQNRLLEIMDEYDCKNNNKKFASLVVISTPVISRATIYGIVPSLRPLIKIADTLDISLTYLLGDSNANDFFMAEPQISFHSRLKELADERKVNFGQISQQMQFPRTYFYEWQKEKTLPSLDYLYEIAEYFDVSIDYLLGRTNIRK